MPNYMPYMQKMNVPMQYSPMMNMPQEQLETMYPRCYYIIYPEVRHHCDMHCAKYGTMCNPSHMQLQAMVDEIDNKVGADIDAEYQDFDENENRQFGGIGFGGHFGGRRRFGRDLISILLLREFLGRRHGHHFGGHHMHFDGRYGEYPY